jgi:hypothetical protein
MLIDLLVHAVDVSGASAELRGHLKLERRPFTARGATLLKHRLVQSDDGHTSSIGLNAPGRTDVAVMDGKESCMIHRRLYN